MRKQTVTRKIRAPVDQVFDTVAHIENFSKAVPHIVATEILGDVKSGPGTRFRETRVTYGREATTELEVTEYVKDEKVRIIADAGGTVWDSIFTTSAVGEDTELKLEMEALPHKLLAKLTTPLIMSMIGKALEADMDAVKTYCEARQR